MTEETGILFNRAFTVVFELKNIKILLKIKNEVYKYTKKCNIIGSASDIDIHSPSYALGKGYRTFHKT